MRSSEHLDQIATALAKAQGEFDTITRSRTVKVRLRDGKGEYEFAYAPLEEILRATRPALAANGLCLTQALGEGDDRRQLVTRLLHSSGQFLETSIPVLVNDGGPQAFGSAMTYARRYGITALLAVVADEDDDANIASGNHYQDAPAKGKAGKSAAGTAPKDAKKGSSPPAAKEAPKKAPDQAKLAASITGAKCYADLDKIVVACAEKLPKEHPAVFQFGVAAAIEKLSTAEGAGWPEPEVAALRDQLRLVLWHSRLGTAGSLAAITPLFTEFGRSDLRAQHPDNWKRFLVDCKAKIQERRGQEGWPADRCDSDLTAVDAALHSLEAPNG